MATAQKVHGADVSHHQGDLDLGQAVEAGLEFLYHKASEASSFVDDEYNKRREDARAVGLAFGPYHFGRFTSVADAIKEARFFVEKANPLDCELLPVLDIETMGGMRLSKIIECCKAFVDEVKRLTGLDVIFYTPYDLKLPGLYWRPRYNRNNEVLGRLAEPKLSWDIWQFSDGRLGVPDSFPGLGHVDLNTFAKGRSLKDILIKKPPKKEFFLEELKLLQSSMQGSDKQAEIIDDVRQMFNVAVNNDVDLICLSETDRHGDVMPHVRVEAFRRGWWLQDEGVTGDCRFILNPKNKLLESGYVHVLDGQGGMPAGNFSNRGVAEITFETVGGNIITDHSSHWLTAFELDRRPGAEHPREAKFDKQTEAMIERVLLHGKGRRLSFWQGDTNLNEEKDTGFDHDAIHYQFKKAGLLSIYDELMPGENLPSTHGSAKGGTIDIIGSLEEDTRVKPVSVRVLPRRGRHSDHLMVLGVYSIKTLIK